jgi:hypothetical protein
MDNSTHNDILLHLQKHGSITGAEAYEKYRCYRLSSVINRLRDHHIIETSMTDYVGQYGKKSRYATYLYWGKRDNGEKADS